MKNVNDLNAISQGHLPGLIGVRFVNADLNQKQLQSELALRAELMAPNGYLHAATVIALADTTCGYGVLLNLPDEAQGFTTIELKTNFIGTAREGIIRCEGTLVHAGRSTQVWDARVDDANGRPIALFRCTQMILYQRNG